MPSDKLGFDKQVGKPIFSLTTKQLHYIYTVEPRPSNAIGAGPVWDNGNCW